MPASLLPNPGMHRFQAMGGAMSAGAMAGLGDGLAGMGRGAPPHGLGGMDGDMAGMGAGMGGAVGAVGQQGGLERGGVAMEMADMGSSLGGMEGMGPAGAVGGPINAGAVVMPKIGALDMNYFGAMGKSGMMGVQPGMDGRCVMVDIQAGMQAQPGVPPPPQPGLHSMPVAGVMQGAQAVHGQGAGVAGNLYAQSMQGMQDRLAVMAGTGAVGVGMRGPAGRCGRGDGGGQTDCCSCSRARALCLSRAPRAHTHTHRCAIGGISW